MRLILFLLHLSLLPCLSAQQFSGQGGLIPDASGFVAFDIAVSGLPDTAAFPQFGLEQVCLDIIHTYNDDLEIYLKAPDNTLIYLAGRLGGSSDNFLGTCFRADAANSILQAQGPFSGVFRPIGVLGNVNNGQNPNGVWQLIIRDVAPPDQGSLLGWSLKFSSLPAAPFGYAAGNLPLVRINTMGNAITNGPKIMARMEIVDKGPGLENGLYDTANAFKGWIGIEKRGHSSSSFPQPQYNVETRDSIGNNLNVSLLGMPAENDWVLYGPYNDKSLMRNVLTYEMGRRLGRYASRWRFCEVFVNGNYQGVYTFFESVKRDSARVKIASLKPEDVSGAELTGGYICSIDWPDDGGWFSQFPPDPVQPQNNQVFFQYVEPPDDEIQPEQQAYIASFVDSFERALYSPDFTNPVNGWRRFAAEGSFVDFFIINELSKNVDAYRLSTFFYKEKITDGNKIHMGPLWDFNLAWRNADYCGNNLPGGWAYRYNDFCNWDMPGWWKRLLQDSGFRNRLKCRWLELRDGILSNNAILGFIDSTATRLEQAQQRHFQLYPVWGLYLWPNPAPLAQNYAQEISLMKSWIVQRLSFLDNNLPGICNPASVSEKENGLSGIRVISGSEGQLLILEFDENNPEEFPAELRLTDLSGRSCYTASLPGWSPGGKAELRIPVSAGHYFLRLTNRSGMPATVRWHCFQP
jgi:hypothetical protein